MKKNWIGNREDVGRRTESIRGRENCSWDVEQSYKRENKNKTKIKVALENITGGNLFKYEMFLAATCTIIIIDKIF